MVFRRLRTTIFILEVRKVHFTGKTDHTLQLKVWHLYVGDSSTHAPNVLSSRRFIINKENWLFKRQYMINKQKIKASVRHHIKICIFPCTISRQKLPYFPVGIIYVCRTAEYSSFHRALEDVEAKFRCAPQRKTQICAALEVGQV